ncbi:TPA: hypothetical protein N0F65_006893 [Lagenidium giganteum]|uniref:RRM domain-containing protein n=1 Tax=Lagenidium giganteum TaxID=4803 RepID=A0AAV2ZFR5_9STRA|nr:TPA: hypothetical protein N0F65_006893 [Lagenidium giganteum]
MTDDAKPMNAKERRKLKREQEQKQLQQEQEVKDKPEFFVDVAGTTEPAMKQEEPSVNKDNGATTTLNAKERRKLKRQQQLEADQAAKAKAEAAVKSDDTVASSVAKPVKHEAAAKPEEKPEAKQPRLTAQERRLLKRKAARAESNPEELKKELKEALNSRERRALKRKQEAEAAEAAEQNGGKKRRRKAKKTESADDNGENQKSIHLTLFLGQLPYNATEAMIRKHFEEAGEIKVRMLTDKKTKKFKGTAFIEVKDSKALGAALSRHHTLMNGRRINVELTAGGGGNKSEKRREKIEKLRSKQSDMQVEKTKALVQKHIEDPECKLTEDDVDERMVDFLSWFDFETAKKALDEYNRCVCDRVKNRKAFFMGILKRFRETDGVE